MPIDPFFRVPPSADTSGWNRSHCRYFPRCDRPARWIVNGKPCCHQCYYWGELDDLGRSSFNSWSDARWRAKK